MFHILCPTLLEYLKALAAKNQFICHEKLIQVIDLTKERSEGIDEKARKKRNNWSILRRLKFDLYYYSSLNIQTEQLRQFLS